MTSLEEQSQNLSALRELQKVLSQEQLKTDMESIQIYGKDWTTYFDVRAMAVVFPESNDDVVLITKWARKYKIPLVPSGGRTGLSGAACATAANEVIVSFEKMDQILSFNSIEQTVTVQAGVITEKLQQYAHSKNLYYPVDFAARGSSQMGGNIATNAGGIKVLRFGMTRQWVMGLTVVTGTGELLTFNKNLVKNATGYDLRHLFIGSEGTLGFITEVTLRLIHQPPETQVLLVGVPSLDAIMNVFEVFNEKVALSAFEMFSDKALNIVMSATQLPAPLSRECSYYLVIEYDKGSITDEDRGMKAFEICMEKGWVLDGSIAQSEQQARNIWRYREDITEASSRFTPYKNDISVTISQVPSFMQDLDCLLTEHYPEWEIIWFGHVGDGNLHISVLRPQNMTKEDFLKECRRVDQLLFETIQKYNGSISAEHGVGLTKKPFLNYTRPPVEIEFMKGIKKVFDPDNIMNPGKIF